LLGAATGFQDFSVVGDGNSCYFCIEDGTNWEVSLGTYTSSGTTLSRTTVLASSNANALVSFGAGTKNVFVTAPASWFGTPLTAASVPFADSSGRLSQDNTNFSFDDTLNLLKSPICDKGGQVFNVKAYGARGDTIVLNGSLTSGSATFHSGSADFTTADVGKTLSMQGGGTTRTVTDGAINSGSKSLTSATGAFTSADIGSEVNVAGAGAAGGTLSNVVIGWVVSTTNVILTTAASTTVTGASTTISAPFVTTFSAYVGVQDMTMASGNAPVSMSSMPFSYGTDDTVAINAAITAALVNGGRVFFPPGQYTITSTLTLGGPVILTGSGTTGDIFNVQNSIPKGTTLVWAGAVNGTMIKLTPSTSTNPVLGVTVEDMNLDGRNGIAGTGLRIEATQQSIFRNLYIRQCKTVCLDLGARALAGYTGLDDVYSCAFENLWLFPNLSGIGLQIDGIPTSGIDNSPTYCSFKNFHILYGYGNGITFQYGDDMIFFDIGMSRQAGGTGYGIEFKGSNDRNYCNNNAFFGLNPGPGGVMSRGIGLNRPAANNMIVDYGLAGGAGFPTVENGSTMNYSLDDGTIFDNTMKPGSPIFQCGNVGYQIAALYGIHLLGGQTRLQALATPSAPTVVLGGGTGSGTNYSYAIVAEDVNGFRTLPSAITTFSGPSSLTTANWLKITWTAVPGAVKYYVLKGTTPANNTVLTLTGTWLPAAGATANGYITGISLTSGGSGYSNGTFTDGTISNNGTGVGTGATFAYTIAGGIVTNIAITNHGTAGYNQPTIALGASAGAGSGFAAVPLLGQVTYLGGTNLEADDTGQAANGTLTVPARNNTADLTVDTSVSSGAHATNGPSSVNTQPTVGATIPANYVASSFALPYRIVAGVIITIAATGFLRISP